MAPIVTGSGHDSTSENSRTEHHQVQNLTPSKSKGTTKMTREQFKQWLDKVDLNDDGYISWNELYGALQVLGLKFKTWKVWKAMRKIDLNQNNVIDIGRERDLLVEYAEKHWGIIQAD